MSKATAPYIGFYFGISALIATVASPAAALKVSSEQIVVSPTSNSTNAIANVISDSSEIIGTTVPEPTAIALLGLGFGLYFGAAQMRRRKRQEDQNEQG